MIILRNNGHGGITYNSAMTVIAQDDHLTARAWVACVLSGLNLIIDYLTLFAFVFILLC